MNQNYSVQIYQECFNITVKKKQSHFFDEGYFSSPESEMEEKREAGKLKVQLNGKSGEQVLDVRAHQGLANVCLRLPSPQGLPVAQAKVKKKHQSGAKDRAPESLLCLGQDGHTSKVGSGHLPIEVHSSMSGRSRQRESGVQAGLSILSSIRGRGRSETGVAKHDLPLRSAAVKGHSQERKKMQPRGKSMPPLRSTGLRSNFLLSRHLAAQPPASQSKQGQAAPARLPSQSRSSSSPPQNLSNLELYQFKLQNYMFCPEMKNVDRSESFSTDGNEGSSEGNFEEAEEGRYEEDDYVPANIGLSPYLRTQPVNVDLAISALSLDRLSQEGGSAEEEVDADGDDYGQADGQRAGDQQLQQRVPPGQAGGGAEGGAGLHLNDNVLETGRRTTKNTSHPEGGNRRLLIKINPGKWGFPDPAQHSSSASIKAFKNYYHTLFQEVAQYEGFDWSSEECQQFFASAIVRLAKRGEPGAIENGDFDDYFEYAHDGMVTGSNISLDLTLVLNGVEQDDPTQFFPPVSNCNSDQQLDCSLRQGQVLLYQMVADLNDKNIEVAVEYAHSEMANGESIVTNYLDGFIKSTVFATTDNVRSCLQNIFQFQQTSGALSQAIRNLDEDMLDEFDQQICDYVFGAGSDDNLKKAATLVMERLSRLKKVQRHYENQGLKLYGSSSLKVAFVRKEFENQNSLLSFLNNEATEEQNWVREPNKWCTGHARLRFGGAIMKMTFCPSRLFISKDAMGYEAIVVKAKGLVDQAMGAVRGAGAGGPSVGLLPPGAAGGGGAPPPSPPSPPYPAHIVADAETFLVQVQTLEFKTASPQVLDQLHKSGGDISRELQQCLWRSGLSLKREDKAIQDNLKIALMHLAGAVKEKSDEQKLKEIEQRELSKSISSAKAPTLSASGREIQAYLEFHENFRGANSLARALKLREGMVDELKERFVHEVDPEKILSMLKNMFLAQDVLLPLSRQNLVQLPNCPPVGTKQELKAYSEILGFVAKLEKADMLERLDFSTMALIVQKLSRQRIDNWDREWVEEQLRIESEPLRVQEDRKRQMLINFLRINESILHRRLLQTSLTSQEKTQPKKDKRENVLATSEVRPTRFDRKANKGSVNKGDKVEDRKQNADDSGYRCVLCNQSGGHPKKFPPTKVNTGAKSLARCPTFKAESQEKKMDLVKKMSSCQRCLSTSHESDRCFLSPSTPWLSHSCAGGQTSSAHNPSICPHKAPQGNIENVHKVTAEQAESMKKGTLPINLVETAHIKKHQNSVDETVAVIWDSCSDSHWVSKSYAQSLPQKTKKKVALKLNSIPAKKTFHTWEYTIFIRVQQKLKQIKLFEASGEIGTFNINSEIKNKIQAQYEVPITFTTGKVQILLGLRDFGIYPMPAQDHPSPPCFPDLQLHRSRINSDLTYLVAGSLQMASVGRGSKEDSCEDVNLTLSQLHKAIIEERGPDLPPLLCPTCRLRSRRCYKCSLMTRPMSIQEQNEVHLITSPMKFDQEKRQVTTHYLPITGDSFKDLFPPSLSNKNQAAAIARRTLRSLQKDKEVQIFEDALKKFVDRGVFKDVTDKEIEEYDKKQLPHNFISLVPVKKIQSDPNKVAFRLTANSSLPRQAYLKGQQATLSLNNVLPKASPSMNSLTDVTLQWLEKTYAITVDQKTAYHSISSDSSENGAITNHLRRIYWFQNPFEEKEEKLKPRILVITCCQFGDACSAAILDAFRKRVIEDMIQNNKEHNGKLVEKSSFADDNALSVNSLPEALEFCKDMKDHFQVYGADLHPAIISSKYGRFDESGKKCEKPMEEDEQESRLFGFLYNSYDDTVKIPIQRKLNFRKRGLRVAEDLNPQHINQLKVTMRLLSSFQMSIYDNCGFLSILTVRGRQLLSKVQSQLTPAVAKNWDKVLPDTDNLLQEARAYIHMMVTTPDVIFPRSPPDGVLQELHAHVDGSTDCFSASIWGVWISTSGVRDSKLLYAKTRIGKQTVPRNEMASMNLGIQILANMVKIYKTIKSVFIFGDSEAVNLQMKTGYKPRDVFLSNKYNSIQANIEEMKDAGIEVEVFLVRSAENQADPCSKFLESSTQLINSDKWWRGVEWMRKKREAWPIVDVNVQPKKEQMTKPDEMGLQDVVDPVPITLLSTQAKPLPSKATAMKPEHIFSRTMERCSRINVVVRAVARVKGILKKRSFKIESPTFQDEEEAFSCLVKLEQSTMHKPPKGLLVREVDGLQVTSQRWSPAEHLDLYRVPHLPVLPVDVRLGHLLLQHAHRPPAGPCAGERHTLLHLRTQKYPVFLFGSVQQALKKLRSMCVACIKQRGEPCHPQIKFDKFKTNNFNPWSSVSIDMWGHFLVTDSPKARTTRRTKVTYKKKYVLGVIDNSGLSALNLIPMADASARSFCTALMTHFAETNVVAREIYSDRGTNFLAVARQENNNNNNDNNNNNNNTEAGELVSEEIRKQFPGIKWNQTPPHSQWRNGLIERSFGLAKQYIHGVFHNKQTDHTPHFTSEGLWLICKEMSNFFNSRAVSWLKSNDVAISPNMFLKSYSAPDKEDEVWANPYGLEKAFENLQEFRSRMKKLLKEYYQSANFPATRWYDAKNQVATNDVVLHCRNQSKFCKGIQEYGRVMNCSEDQRDIELSVNRKGVKKTVIADARNVVPILKANILEN